MVGAYPLSLPALVTGAVLEHALRVIRKGYGYPSVFNSDAVVMEQIRVGKSVEDARQGGTSGCIETGAFGKEAYILTGYLNVPKIFEITLNNGRDPLTGAGPVRAGEELDVVGPAAERLRTLGLDVRGPVPADTAFTRIPCGPRSRARYRVTDCSADLATPIQL